MTRPFEKRSEHAMLSKQEIRKENNMTFCFELTKYGRVPQHQWHYLFSFGQRSVGCNIQKRLYLIFGWADRYSGWALNYTQTRSELISGKSVKRVSISWSSKHLSNSTTAKTQILNIVIYNRVHFNVRFFLGLSSSCKKK